MNLKDEWTKLPLQRKQLVVLVAAFIALPVLVLAVKIKNTYFTRAATPYPAKLLLPSSVAATVGQEFSVVLSLDTGGGATIGTDVRLKFDPNQLTASAIVPVTNLPLSTFVPINSSGVFDSTNVISSANSTGVLSFSALGTNLSSQSITPYTGAAPLVTLKFIPKQAGNLNVAFDFTPGSTSDSNVSLAGSIPEDTLSSVGNLVVAVSSAVTPAPSPLFVQSPTVTILTPANGAIVSRLNTISITTSVSSQAPISNVIFSVNGSTTCTDATSPYNCIWKVPGKKGAKYTISATATDNRGQTSSQSIQVTVQ